MKKKFLLLLAVILLLFSFQSVLGEETITGRQMFYVYFPTQSVSEFRTIQYLVNARSARWTKGNPYYANINLQKLYDQEHMTDAIKTGRGWDGNLSPKVKSSVLDVISSQAAGVDLCLLIPSDSVKTVFQQGDFFSWLLNILQAGKSKVHFFLIGGKTEIPEGTKELFREYSDYYDVTRLASDFLQETVKETEEDLHTGEYYIASLYGTPMDLLLTEEEEGKLSFHLHEEGQVFFLTREERDLIVESEQGAIVPNDETKAIRVRGPEKKDPGFIGNMTVSIPAGNYTIRQDGAALENGGLKAYWYPDLENLTVAAVMPETFLHGDNIVRFTLSNDYGRPSDIRVEYRTSFDGEEPGLAIPAEYTDEGVWTAVIHAEADQNQIRLLPAARLNAGDGNLLFTVSGEATEMDIRNQAVELRDEIPEVLTLYLDPEKEQRGTLSYHWADFFVYNAADEPHQFMAKVDQSGAEESTGEEKSVEIRLEEEGFSVTASRENGDTPAVLTVSCDGTIEKKISVFCRDIGSTVSEMVQVESEQQGQNLKPGQEMILKVTLDEKLPEIMEQAAMQGVKLPDAGSLAVWTSMDGQKKQRSLANTAETELSFVMENEAGGEKTVSYQIVSEKASEPEETEEKKTDGEISAAELPAATGENGAADQTDPLSEETSSGQNAETEIIAEPEREWKAGSISFVLKNGAPEAAEGIKEEVILPLHGLFGKYEPVELFQNVFGTDDPRTLFHDEETDIESVSLEMEGLEGIETDETSRGLTETGKIELTSPTSIRFTEPYPHTLTLTAFDGVNHSQPLVVKVKVYSLFIHYLIGAGIAVAVLLVILTIILIVRQARKPSFQNIRIRCLTIMDEDQERCRELLGKGNTITLENYGKKPVPMSATLILAGQPPLTEESMKIVRDISLLPTRYDEVLMVFGKDAMKQLGRTEKKERIAQGNIFRIRLDGTWLYVENVR